MSKKNDFFGIFYILKEGDVCFLKIILNGSHVIIICAYRARKKEDRGESIFDETLKKLIREFLINVEKKYDAGKKNIRNQTTYYSGCPSSCNFFGKSQLAESNADSQVARLSSCSRRVKETLSKPGTTPGSNSTGSNFFLLQTFYHSVAGNQYRLLCQNWPAVYDLAQFIGRCPR